MFGGASTFLLMGDLRDPAGRHRCRRCPRPRPDADDLRDLDTDDLLSRSATGGTGDLDLQLHSGGAVRTPQMK